MEYNTNSVSVRGFPASTPELSHENHGRTFYRFLLEVPRLSSATDVLPVITGQELLRRADIHTGCMLAVKGQLRSHNIRIDGKRHLLIYIFAMEITPEEAEPHNDVLLEGVICREPTYRQTPLGREICDIMLSVTRGYHRSDYLPCILWGQTARRFSQCHTGDSVRINGRLQSRNYTKLTENGPLQKTAYEVSALMGEVLEDPNRGL